MWMGGPWGLARYFGGRFTNIPARDGSRIGPVMGLSGNADGTVWAAGEHSGVWRVQDGRADPVEGMQWKDIVRVVCSREGVPWFGSYESGAIRLAGGRSEVFGADSGIRGPLRGLFEDGAGNIWAGAGNTLTRFRHGRRTTWGTREGMPEGQIFGITESRGSLWIATASAVLRLDAAELERAADGAPQPLRIAQYDARDGFHANPAGMPSPRIATARDGRVWAVERDGVAIFDPDLLAPDAAPPPVAIEQLIGDGKPVEGSAPAFRARQIRIVYTGLSLMAPERVRFRYRLEPLGWVDAGTERQVTLANPGPGSYRFRVAAANLDGVWNESGAAIDFRIVPYYYETWWFDVLLMLAAYGVGWVVYRFHMARVKERFQLVAQERARLTREIHDSLLQGFVGVVFQLHAASRQFGSNPEGSKKKLDEALQRADHSIKEARQLLLDMRLPVLEDRTLPEALAEVGVEATKETRIDFQIKTTGVVAPLPYAEQAALFLIGREAIHNAATHAQANRISAQLSYAEKEVRLAVEDDGTGFDPELASRKEGHFGLWSMRERAQKSGGEFRIDTEPGRGSRIEVAMPRKGAVE
jgi:signal transduction histidine kinase